MTKILMIDVIQHLDSLSVEELLAVKTKVDFLIQIKSYSHSIEIPITTESLSELKPENNNSLEKIIALVDEWIADESGYDQETYPQIEAALNKNKLSI
ncbi:MULTISPECIES: hypothetical protein [Sphaerospermopsis]|uniref:Uncharacterized protein n=2 Tax=Sphaerospermopsis TaxID=752201 RepID=A0A480A676_9CYAN|nr:MULTISPECIES: hypothetical protein [Sphaerospermopsis]MBD2134156.1 hypothetical protein [Sphaerospermopsis sp. FACHB-1094]MBD2147477.1 hypothetical protein [Sphaerospermopsis sp. FACHB-1194]MBE9234625.1 hypothetical protein [Sphaerospermopsis aphanizomenoides LEGE 00250]GCL39376.1 hypothetical protein SR1949_45020 [Sphaerospermopsis reniformis]